VNVVATIKDLVGILLLVLLLPVWITLGLGAVAVVVTRQVYWWARGNTTAVSRSAAAVGSSPRQHAARGGTPRALTRDPLAAGTVASLADAPAAGALSPAVPGVSQR
jgi:hypothetical protein